MAGIGFKLKKAFKNKSLYEKSKGFAHAGSVTAGPWLWATIVVGIVYAIFPSCFSISSRTLIAYTVLQSFILSHLLISPVYLIITRYISDMIYEESFEKIRPSFYGANFLLIPLSILISTVFYSQNSLPLTYKIIGIFLLTVVSMTMCIMIYLSSSKDYESIGMSFVIGGFVTTVSAVIFNTQIMDITASAYETTILAEILIGMTVSYLLLLRVLHKTYPDNFEISFVFLSYYRKVPSFALISVFYTFGLWADNFIMWQNYSSLPYISSLIHNPGYDIAVVVGFLTIIPSAILYTVFIETEFFVSYKKFMHSINENSTLEQIKTAHKSMKDTLYAWIFKGFIIQFIITSSTLIAIVYLSNIYDFNFVKIQTVVYAILGSMFLIYAYINLNIILYFDMRKSTLLLSVLFLSSNVLLTLLATYIGEFFIGMGFMLASLIVFTVSSYMIKILMTDTIYIIFSKQNVFK